MQFEIRKIDALNIDGEGWKCNSMYPIGTFKTDATDQKRAFLYALHKVGIVCKRGKMVVISKGNTYEVQNRRTGEPLFIAIPICGKVKEV